MEEHLANRYADEIARLTGEFASVWQRHAQHALGHHGGLTLPQAVALTILAMGDEWQMTEVAQQMGLTRATVSGIITRLVKAGLVTRRRGKEDRRVVKVSLTGKGRRVVSHLAQEQREKWLILLREMSERQARRLVASMGDVVRTMRKMGVKERREG